MNLSLKVGKQKLKQKEELCKNKEKFLHVVLHPNKEAVTTPEGHSSLGNVILDRNSNTKN